jgi:hypothetical protein
MLRRVALVRTSAGSVNFSYSGKILLNFCISSMHAILQMSTLASVTLFQSKITFCRLTLAVKRRSRSYTVRQPNWRLQSPSGTRICPSMLSALSYDGSLLCPTVIMRHRVYLDKNRESGVQVAVKLLFPYIISPLLHTEYSAVAFMQILIMRIWSMPSKIINAVWLYARSFKQCQSLGTRQESRMCFQTCLMFCEFWNMRGTQ